MAAAKKDLMEETTKIMLFKDNGEYKDDLFVSVNGRTWLIQRGVEVEVPVAVANVIKNSMEADMAVANMISEKENNYEAIK